MREKFKESFVNINSRKIFLPIFTGASFILLAGFSIPPAPRTPVAIDVPNAMQLVEKQQGEPEKPADAPKPVEPEKPKELPEDFIKSLPVVYFEFAMFHLTKEAKVVLKKVALDMKRHPKIPVLIEGHCDERGRDNRNFALAKKRAETVKKFLVAHGVKGSRLFIASIGKKRPVDSKHTEKAWTKNRRVQFSPKQS
jgi:peptidoglycan-associated lipoprotein